LVYQIVSQKEKRGYVQKENQNLLDFPGNIL